MDFKNVTITLLFFAAVFGYMHCASAEEISRPLTQTASAEVQNDFSDYMKSIQEKLRKTWQPPDFLEEGHVRVYFKLDRHGNVLNSAVIESSGDDIYDESALETVRTCAPFGEFPQNSTREFIAIKYSFDTILIEEERMNGYYELAKINAKKNPQMALGYINMAIAQVGGEEASYFLYKRRAEIQEGLGNEKEAKEDYEIYNTYVNRSNIKRLHLLKHLSETKPTAYIYYYLAYAYEQVNDYDNAVIAIDKAIELSADNWKLKHYRSKLASKQQTLAETNGN